LENLIKFFGLHDFDVVMIVAFTIIFTMYWVFSSKLVFKPFLELFELKEKLTTGATSSAQELRTEAEKLRRTYEEQILITQKEAFSEKLERIGHAKKQSSRRLSEASSEAKNLIAQGRGAIDQEVQELRSGLSRDVEDLVNTSVDKMLAN
jgi:F0F1-type ATP synthase membrane subunit b/b'